MNSINRQAGNKVKKRISKLRFRLGEAKTCLGVIIRLSPAQMKQIGWQTAAPS
jgi:hypothetical protein